MSLGPVLVLDAALEGGLAAVVDGGQVTERRVPGGRGSASVLPALVAEVLRAAGLEAVGLGRIAVTVGPGSFTGVRAALALAQGIGLASGVAVVGVTVGEAMRAVAGGARPVWVAVGNRRGRVFLDRDGVVETVDVDALPMPGGPVAVAGDAAIAVASGLAARGADVQLLAARGCTADGIAAASERGRVALPLYVDAVAARPNLARPAPCG